MFHKESENDEKIKEEICVRENQKICLEIPKQERIRLIRH